jgi:hypothetical protein
VVSTADLTPNPGGPQAFLQDAYSTVGYTTPSQSSRLDTIAQYHLPIIVSEWSANQGFYAATEPERENVESMLWDAGLLQSFIRHGVIGTTFYSLDGSGWGGGFRILHCSATIFEEYGNDCASASLQPYASVPGQMFSVLKQHIDSSWLSPSVAAPSVTTTWIHDADEAVLGIGNLNVPEVQAVATRAAGTIDLQLINIADHAVSTQVTIAGTTPTGLATFTSLSGNPFAVDGCDQDSLRPANPYNCNTSAVLPTSSQVAGASTMSITLPSDSFSVLAVPTNT